MAQKAQKSAFNRLIFSGFLFLILFTFAGFSQSLVFTFADLKMDDRILLYGDRSQFDFFIPIGYPAEGLSSTVTLFSRVTPLAGPRANVTLLINDIPVDTRFLQGAPQPQIFTFPGDYLEASAFAKFSILVDLDQAGCRVGESISAPDLRALFFSIEKDTVFEIAYGDPAPGSLWKEPSIAQFFDPYGDQNFHFVIDPASLAHLSSMANVAYALGYGSKGFARHLSLSSRASTTAKNIGFQEGNRIVSGISSLTLGTDLTPDMLHTQLFEILPLSQVSVSKSDLKEPSGIPLDEARIPFADLMDLTPGLSIRFSGSQKSFFPLSMIGGVPTQARLILRTSSTPLEHPESVAVNLLLNGQILKSFSFHSKSHDVELSIPMPPQLFRGINELELQWINQTLCREVTLSFDPRSHLVFDAIQPLQAPKMGDFGHLFAGPRTLVITRPSLETARILMEYAFYLGRNGASERSFFLATPQQIQTQMDTIQTYDGVILILDPVEMAIFEPLIDTTRSFRIIDRSRGTTLLEFDSREPLGVITTYSFMQRPAVAFSWYGSSAGYGWIQSRFFDRLVREGGNVLLIGERGISSLAIDKESNWVSAPIEEERSLWEGWRIWVILGIGLFGILIIVIAYSRSSGKQRKLGG